MNIPLTRDFNFGLPAVTVIEVKPDGLHVDMSKHGGLTVDEITEIFGHVGITLNEFDGAGKNKVITKFTITAWAVTNPDTLRRLQ